MSRPKQVDAWKVRIWLRGSGVIHTLSTHEPRKNGGKWETTFPDGMDADGVRIWGQIRHGDRIGFLDWTEIAGITWRPPGEE